MCMEDYRYCMGMFSHTVYHDACNQIKSNQALLSFCCTYKSNVDKINIQTKDRLQPIAGNNIFMK